jgi:hypothetical protein
MRIWFNEVTGEFETAAVDAADIGMLPGPSIDELERWQDEWLREIAELFSGALQGG